MYCELFNVDPLSLPDESALVREVAPRQPALALRIQAETAEDLL